MIKFIKKSLNTILSNTYSLKVIIFSLLSSWLLSFSFEGQSLYAIAKYHNIEINNLNIYLTISILLGLFLCRYFIKNIMSAKRLIAITILLCTINSFVLLFDVLILWTIFLIVSSFFIGCCVASWGWFLKEEQNKNKRFKLVADGLIGSNILMLILNSISSYMSPVFSIILVIIFLITSFLLIIKYPIKESKKETNLIKREKGVKKTLIFLSIFIIVVTITSGFMYAIQIPAFMHLDLVMNWFFVIPYIIAIIILRNLSIRESKSFILYSAITMIGFSFICFMVFDRSVISYLIINTLMLGGCGIFDLFWWSVLGDMLEMEDNPAKIFGVGLSSNIFGILLGIVIGIIIKNYEFETTNTTILALSSLLIAIAILPLLNIKLSSLFKNQTSFLAKKHDVYEEIFSQRENEIVSLMLQGKTYKAISIELNITENTVKYHIKNIYSKLNIQNRSELISIMLEKA